MISNAHLRMATDLAKISITDRAIMNLRNNSVPRVHQPHNVFKGNSVEIGVVHG